MLNLDLISKGNKVLTEEGVEVENVTIFNTNPPMIAGIVVDSFCVWNKFGHLVDFNCTTSSYGKLKVVPIGYLEDKPVFIGSKVFVKEGAEYKETTVFRGVESTSGLLRIQAKVDGVWYYTRINDLFWERPKNKVKAWRWIAVTEHYENIYLSKKFYRSEEEAIADLGVPNVEKILLTETEIEIEVD
jgi:hypothetical protein